MKSNPVDAFGLLSQLNPVPQTAYEDLAARVNQIRPILPPLGTPSRRSVRRLPLVIAALVLVAIGAVGVAIAASWGPLSGIGAAEHPATPADTVGPAVTSQLNADQPPPGAVDGIGKRLTDQARFIGSLPNGTKVYAIPTSKGLLCVAAASLAESCSAPLTAAHPVTGTILEAGPGTPPLVFGVTTDNVVSISFKVGGQLTTVPVHNNLYAWQGTLEQAMAAVTSETMTFADGTHRPVQ